jgi:hypothetical protein
MDLIKKVKNTEEVSSTKVKFIERGLELGTT